MRKSVKYQPLGEVFGFPIRSSSKRVEHFRSNKLCPFNNKVPSCTKDKANDPLGVCSIFHENNLIVTCPIRFRQDWLITSDAAKIFFKKGTTWTTLTEVNLNDSTGKTAGHIDIILVSYNKEGKILDFGSIEVQAVYISGNIRNPFEAYIKKRIKSGEFSWEGKPNFPKPDFLSSSRKRLIPQILYKGRILKGWGKKQAVVLQSHFFNTLPQMPIVKPEKADIAWMIYDLEENQNSFEYSLKLKRIVYTEFDSALSKITTPNAGKVNDFIEVLQNKLDEKLESNPPDTKVLGENDLV